MEQELKYWETDDLYLAAYLKIDLPEIESGFTTKNNRILFVFPMCDDLYKAMHTYNDGKAINAFAYSSMIKRLRTEILVRKRGGE